MQNSSTKGEVIDLVYSLTLRSKELGVSNIASVVIDDPKFIVHSGSANSNTHHYGKYGLIRHTAEVINLCENLNSTFDYGIDEKDLFLAALFHDIGKTYDYDYDPSSGYYAGPHKYYVHHICRSAIIWSKAAEEFKYPEFNVLHAILSHHGQKQYGSPVEPRSKLAWLLHLCDSISARMDDCLKDRNQVLTTKLSKILKSNTGTGEISVESKL